MHSQHHRTPVRRPSPQPLIDPAPRSAARPVIHPLALALHLIFGGACLAAAVLPMPAMAQAQSTAREFDIPAGPLATTLNRIGESAGLLLSFDPALVKGKTAPAIRGRLTAQQALEQALAGSGLAASADGASIVIKTAPPAPVSAKEAVLPVVTVRAGAERETANGPVAGYVAKRSLGATKSDLPLAETPRAVSVITEDQMRDRKVLTVEDAVAYTSGVQVGMSGNDPRFDEIYVRGFDVTTDADYRDGLRQPNSGWLSYSHTEPYALERLEVVKGPDSVTYGQISPGGLVNRVSKRPSRDAVREVEVQLGTNDHRQAQFDLGGELAPQSDWMYRLVGLTRKANTGTVGVNDNSTYIAPALTWAPSARTQVTFLSHWNRFETAGSPKPFQAPDGTLTEFWNGDVDFDGLKQTQWALGYEARHQFADDWTVRQNLRYTRAHTDNQYLEGTLDADGTTILRDSYGVYEKMRTLAVDTALEGHLSTGALHHALTLGLDHSRLNADVSYLYGSAPSISMTSPDYHQTVTRPDTVLVEQGVKGTQTGLYLNDQITVDNWRLSAGVRRDTVRQTQTDLSTGERTPQTDHATTGSLGVLYRIDNTWSPYASVATSFIPQFGSNLAGDAFNPTKGKQVELGLKYQPDGGRVSHTLSVFNLVQQNVKTRDPANEVNYVQTGEVRSRGLELESNLSLAAGLDLTASYTYSDVRITRNNDGNEGKRPITTPKHMAAAWVHKRFGSGLLQGVDLGLGARWTGETFADAANTARNAGYTIVDARIGYDLREVLPGAKLGLNATNLTDKRYLSCQDGYCYRGRGRTVVASFNYQW